MDFTILQFLTNFGATGIFIILLVTGIVVPRTYVSRLEKTLDVRDQELEVQRQIAKDAMNAAAIANQYVGTMKAIAEQRSREDGA